MTRQEFLQELRLALQGQLSQTAINENVRYYENYIMEEVHKGSSEEAVISRLGNPRLIAKTLINTTDSFGRAAEGAYYSDDYGQTTSGRGIYRDNATDEEMANVRQNPWYGRIFLIVAAILIIVVVANVIAFLLPILVPIIIIFLVYSLFSGKRR